MPSKGHGIATLLNGGSGSGIPTESIANDAITSDKIADNIEFQGQYIKVPVVDNTSKNSITGPADGILFYNSETGFFEQRRSGEWSPIASPPSIYGITPNSFNGEAGTSIQINGANFDASTNVKIIDVNGTQYTPATTNRVSSNLITITTPVDFTADLEPFDIKVTTGSGLTATSEQVLDAGGAPTWNTAAGEIADISDATRSSYGLIQLSAADSEASITYSIVSGNLPTGLSLNSSTGEITGTAAQEAINTNTSYSFTVRASDGVNNTDRQFSIRVRGKAVVQLLSGSGTWTVPTGVTSIRALVIAGGGGHGGAGGGAGGLVDVTSLSVTPGQNISYSIGGPGTNNGQTISGWSHGTNGGNTTFGSITAIGGGGGGGQAGMNGLSGGSGGGGGGSGGVSNVGNNWGSATQGNSGGFTGYGNRGGAGSGTGQTNNDGAGGGGGAGGVGYNSWHNPQSLRGFGGEGFTSDITGTNVGYAGGGHGGNILAGETHHSFWGASPTQGSDAGGTCAPARTGSGAGGSARCDAQVAVPAGGSVIIQY